MNAITITPVVLSTIKGDAMNKARARVWVERDLSELIEYGFTIDMRMDVDLRDDGIVITFNPDGKRKPTIRRGKKTKVVFDICMPVDQRERMFNGSKRLTVWASAGRLMVTV